MTPSAQAALDPRRHPYRTDLAAASLAGHVEAARFVTGERRQVLRAAVPLRRAPVPTAGLDSEVLFGETVVAYEDANGWAWVQLETDGYVGYVPSNVLVPDIAQATHRVKAVGTFVYPAPDIKSPPVMHLSLNSRLSVVETDERFCRLKTGGYVVSRHTAEAGRHARDFVAVAESLIGSPYLWGGKTRIGLDCSALVQLSLEAAGIPAPRDSDMQEAELGERISVTDHLDELQRGDLVFWRGHVGIMADGVMLLHANAHHMAVVMEALPQAAERIARTGSTITAVKRLAARTGTPPST